MPIFWNFVRDRIDAFPKLSRWMITCLITLVSIHSWFANGSILPRKMLGSFLLLTISKLDAKQNKQKRTGAHGFCGKAKMWIWKYMFLVLSVLRMQSRSWLKFKTKNRLHRKYFPWPECISSLLISCVSSKIVSLKKIVYTVLNDLGWQNWKV